MCNEAVYYGNTFNVDGKLFTTGPSGASNYLQAFIGNQSIPWLAAAAQAAAAGGKPFFAYLAPHAPHFPAEPAPWCGGVHWEGHCRLGLRSTSYFIPTAVLPLLVLLLQVRRRAAAQ